MRSKNRSPLVHASWSTFDPSPDTYEIHRRLVGVGVHAYSIYLRCYSVSIVNTSHSGKQRVQARAMLAFILVGGRRDQHKFITISSLVNPIYTVSIYILCSKFQLVSVFSTLSKFIGKYTHRHLQFRLVFVGFFVEHVLKHCIIYLNLYLLIVYLS